MSNLLRKYSLIGGRLVFWNCIILVLIKLVLPQSAFQLASLVDSIPVFDSREIISMTNQSRLENNLMPLQPNSKLDLAAAEKLNDMAVEEYFAHVSPSGINPWFWIKKAGYSYSVAGENLAIGFSNAKDTVEAWLNSPSHRANMLNGKYQEIGVAVKGVEINGRQGILVVQMFGVPAQAVYLPPSPVPTAPAPQVAVAVPTDTALTKGTVDEPQHLSTDISVSPVISPVTVEFQESETIVRSAEMVNTVFSAYALGLAILSALAFFIFERSRTTAWYMAFHVAILFISVFLPLTEISSRGLIF